MSDLISWNVDRPFPSVKGVPGAFEWMYLDLCDANGNGVVAIWSSGLPFLPGLGEAVRQGRAEPPEANPSVNIAVYREGKPIFYGLHRFDPAQVQGERFGASRFQSWKEDGFRRVRLEIDEPIPGSDQRLIGRVEGSAPIPRLSHSLGDSSHRWEVLGIGQGSAELRLGNEEFSLEGRMYHDRNAAPWPIFALGIRDWSWGRLAFPDRNVVWYHLRGTADQTLLFEIDPDGIVKVLDDATVSESRLHRTLYGMYLPMEVKLSAVNAHISVRTRHMVDSGPFYLRQMVEATDGSGQNAVGFAETVVPDRVDRDGFRPFVQMAVHEEVRPNSSLLPLLAGPFRNRWARLWRWWAR